MTRLKAFEEMCKRDAFYLLNDLQVIQGQCDGDVTEIDVRLCVDFDLNGRICGEISWIIRSGDSSYDQRHSMICGASSIDAEAVCQDVLEDLIDQCADQCAEIDSIQGLDQEGA
jgi:hypothetical protein